MILNIKGVDKEVTPVNEFKFPGEYEPEFGGHFQLTCLNHTDARWLTKNPNLRHLHFIEGPAGHPFTECPCPYSDLVVILDGGDA